MRKLFLILPAVLVAVVSCAVINARASAVGCPSGTILLLNPITGTAACKSTAGGSSSEGGQGAATQRPYRDPTADEILALYTDPDMRAALLQFGLVSPRAIAEGSGRCVMAGGRAQQWSGSGWVDVGTVCPLDMVTAAPRITPAEAAAAAIARVQFTSAAPGAGPNRSINKLPFDVPVGYPVWLWAEGGTTAPRTATDAVGGRSVKLTVNFEHLTWDMGDGSRPLTCGVGTKWTPATATGAKSPTCGYTYQRMGDYTITATTHWRIDWVVDGVSGSQDFALSQRRPWSVGELQVLVR